LANKHPSVAKVIAAHTKATVETFPKRAKKMSDEEENNYGTEDEEYQYSDPEDLQPQESIGHFQIPEGSFRIMDHKDIYPMLEGYVSDISGLLGIRRDLALILLQKSKWNKERLVDHYCSDSERVLQSAGIGIKKATPNLNQIQICRICGDNFQSEELFSLGCGHVFCRLAIISIFDLIICV
jgi:hypothetical protein